MTIEFSCDKCGRQLRAPKAAVGRKSRCPDCGNVTAVPAPSPPLPPAARQGMGNAVADYHAGGATVVSQPNWTVRIVVGTLGVCMIVIGLVGYYSYSSGQKKMVGRDRLTRLIDEQIRMAVDEAERYEFGTAKQLLGAAATQAAGSPYANAYLIDDLNRKLDGARYDFKQLEATYREKTRAGWMVIDGRLVSPADQQRALAEKKRRDEEAAQRKIEEQRLAEARAKAEAEARERKEREQRAAAKAEKDRARQAAERKVAERMVAATIGKLPSLQTALDDRKYISDRANWLMWYLTMQLVSMGSDRSKQDPTDYQMLREDVTKLVESVAPSASPLLVAYRSEVLDIMRTLDYPAYVASPDLQGVGKVPVRFASHNGKLVLLMGSVLSDTTYNRVNSAMNTAKKRAASFMQREVLPVLSSSRIPERLKSAQLGYFGIMFVYGNKNFVRENDTPTPESLCIVLPMNDYVAFVNRELSQERLVRNSMVFLASESPNFVLVELNLE